MADFNAAAVRFGLPGKLYIAPLGSEEPTTPDEAWDDSWICLGYTDEGSVINYELSTDNVEVAEELDVLARVTTGRDASVEVALAEVTKRNLNVAFNGGIVLGVGGVTPWLFEPPDLGSEQRIMLGWDAYPIPADNDLRFIFRQCMQGGSIGLENRKGATKSTITANFQLEKPDIIPPATTPKKILAILGAPALDPVDPVPTPEGGAKMHKDFDAMLAELGGRPTFTIGGQKFTARAKLPWRKFATMLDTMSADADAGRATEATERFLTVAVVRGDRERFVALLQLEDNDDDDEAGISPSEINALSNWLMEHYTGKLADSDSSSSAGPPTTGPSRKVVSLNPRAAAG